jgi:hypothetical protein
MALTYRNVLKNHVVEVPEPADIIAAAEVEAERLFRKGSKRDRLDAELLTDRARAQAAAQRQTLAKMDQSRRWERHVAPPVAVQERHAPPPAHAEAPAATPAGTPAGTSAEAPMKAAKAAAKKETEA